MDLLNQTILLEQATNRNIIIYDCEAKAGDFTKRLAAIVRTIVRRNVFEYPYKLYVSKEVGFEHEGNWFLLVGGTLMGMQAEEMHPALKNYYLKELKGSFPYDKTELVMFETASGHAFLGAY